MMADELLNAQDLITAKKHDTFHSEVITGKTGGLSTGANIDYATNAVTGQTQTTLPKLLSNVGFSPAGFDFTTGGTLTERDKAIFYQTDGNWYSWGGTLPKVVPPASSPASTGGIADNAWNVSTSAFMYRDWEGFTAALLAQAGIVDDGLPDKLGDSQRVEAIKVVSRNNTLAVTPAYVDAYITLTNSDTDAIDAAMSASKHVIFGSRKYTYTKELISVGHTLDGAVSETFSETGTIIEFDIPLTPLSGFSFRNILAKACIRNIKFIQKDWSIPLNGFKPERLVDTQNVEFSYFNGHGCVLTSVDSLAEVCYSSTFKNITCDYNAKHGILLGGAANAIVIENPRCRWNGSPSYGVKPTVAGLYDGIYSGGKNSEYTGNPATFNDPQGVIIIGGNLSYNSRIGLNLERFFDGVVVGGYAEVNLVSDIKIRTMLGSVVVNFLSQSAPDVVVPLSDPLNPSYTLLNYPNDITIRGKSYGNGTASSTLGYYNKRMDALNSIGSAGTLKILPIQDGSIRLTRDGGTSLKFHAGDVPLLGRIVGMGDGFTDTTTATRLCPTVRRAGNVEGDEALVVETTSQYLRLMIANGGGANAAATAAYVPKNSTTNRSINAGGTVNTSGADYAEYMVKSDLCGEIKKGDICGVDASGKLTDKFDDAVSFVIKSTDPAYVGGDNWGSAVEPVRYAEYENWLLECGNLQAEKPIQREDEPEQAFMVRYQEWVDKLILLTKEEPEKRDSEEWLEWEAELENRRQRVDRIAFSGQVPCNVTGAVAGDYILPYRNENGGISGKAVRSPDFEQYRNSVGQVWKVLDDGRAWVAVKIT